MSRLPARSPEHLLDVNILIALTFTSHVHHRLVKDWFNTSPELRWAICAFTEAGFLRFAMASRPNQLAMSQAAEVLDQLARHPGYRYLPMSADWHTLTEPFSRRLHGHNQITDAYLIGLALREGLILVTLDKRIFHMAAEHRDRVLLLEEGQAQ